MKRVAPKRVSLLAALSATVVLFLASAAWAQTVPVRLIGGRMIVRVTLKGPAGEVPSHLLVDLGSPDSLVLHKNAVEMMGLADQAVKVLDLTVGDTALTGIAVAQRDNFPEVEQITREHASELEEVPVSGMIGLAGLTDQAAQLDLPAQVIRIAPIDQIAKSQTPGAIELEYEPTSSGPVFPAFLPDGNRVRVLFGTRQYESLAEFDTFKALNIGRDDVVPVRMGSIDLIAYSAYRPSGLPGVSRPLPELVVGIQLLSAFRVTIDVPGKHIRFEPVKPPLPHASEQSYFIADFKNDADGIEAFLDAHPQTWLKTEAAGRLVEMRLNDQDASEASIAKSLDLYAESLPKERRSQLMMMIVDQHLSAADPRGLSILRKSLELAGASAGDDMNAAASHQINARKGLLAMREGNLKEARRLLLSAAFGTPGDAKVNLWLGELYRLNKQPARAWSRFVEAAMTRDAPIEAIRALEDLGRDPAFRKSFTMADAELMLEGRLLSFSPPKLRTQEETASVRLIELFADATRPESLGPQLAFDGLRQFYEGAGVVFVKYHLDGSLGNATGISRFKRYALRAPQAVLCDGALIDRAPADETAAPKLFETYLQKTAGPAPAEAIKLTGQAAWNGTKLEAKVQLRIDHPPLKDVQEPRLIAIVCERCVFALGGNGTGLHYNVARGNLGGPEGLAISTTESSQAWDLAADLADMSRRRKQPATSATAPASAPAGDGPAWMRAADPDPRECFIAVFVQDSATHKVLGAAVLKPATEGGQP